MRPYPKILRTTEAADRDLREYAAEYEIEPYEALVVAIDRLRDPAPAEELAAAVAGEQSARAEIGRITADWRAALAETERVKALALERAGTDATEIKRLTRELTVAVSSRAVLADDLASAVEREQRAALAAVEPCACADAPKIPRDLMARVKARIAARPGRDFAFVVKNGCDRLEGSDGYQDRQKAARAAERA